MKYIITDNIRVARASNSSEMKKRPIDYLRGSIWIRRNTSAGSMTDAIVTGVSWASQGVVVLTVDELGEYTSPLQKEILKVAAQTKPKRISDVKIYWRG